MHTKLGLERNSGLDEEDSHEDTVVNLKQTSLQMLQHHQHFVLVPEIKIIITKISNIIHYDICKWPEVKLPWTFRAVHLFLNTTQYYVIHVGISMNMIIHHVK